MRMIKCGAMLLALCVNFGCAEAMLNNTNLGNNERISKQFTGLFPVPFDQETSDNLGDTLKLVTWTDNKMLKNVIEGWFFNNIEYIQQKLGAGWVGTSFWKEGFYNDMPAYARQRTSGTFQTTGLCHASTMAIIMEALMACPDVVNIYSNMSLTVATDGEIDSSLRPDLIIKLASGKFGIIEVASRRQSYDSQRKKIWGIIENYGQYIDAAWCAVIDPQWFPKFSPYRHGEFKLQISPKKPKILQFKDYAAF